MNGYGREVNNVINRSWISLIVVIVFGLVMFYGGTDGFTAFTTETARVNKLMQERPAFPKATIIDSKEREYTIDEFAGKHVLITFMYTACTTVCVELEKNMYEVYEMMPKGTLDDLMFLSISFDPERDDPERLEKYRTYFNSDGETWRMGTITDEKELGALLKAFGVIVIPDDYGHFAHNSAFYLIDEQSTLLEVMDYRKTEEAAEKIISILYGEMEDAG